jgi:prevent-host-death family protein
MSITTISSREFGQDTAGAKRAAAGGPVFITARGKPAHVLLTIDDFRRLAGQSATIVDLLAADETAAIDFDPPRLNKGFYRPADLS